MRESKLGYICTKVAKTEMIEIFRIKGPHTSKRLALKSRDPNAYNSWSKTMGVCNDWIFQHTLYTAKSMWVQLTAVWKIRKSCYLYWKVSQELEILFLLSLGMSLIGGDQYWRNTPFSFLVRKANVHRFTLKHEVLRTCCILHLVLLAWEAFIMDLDESWSLLCQHQLN